MSTIILLGQKGQHLYIGMAFSCECTGLRSVLDLGAAHTWYTLPTWLWEVTLTTRDAVEINYNCTLTLKVWKKKHTYTILPDNLKIFLIRACIIDTNCNIGQNILMITRQNLPPLEKTRINRPLHKHLDCNTIFYYLRIIG